MAKGNLLLGTAANSVGDVTMYRREGAQVSRVRVRKVANPKTSAQCLQRSAFAPAAKFFSPLSIVLERSFEGLSKSKSYSKFLKNAVEDARANDWLLPKGTGFFPLPYKLSQGSVQSLIGMYDSEENNGLLLTSLSVDAAPTTIGALSTAFVSAGYHAGDIVTIIAVLHSAAEGSEQVLDYKMYPFAVQFEIDTTSTATIASLVGTQLAIVKGGSNIVIKAGEDIEMMAGAVIVSRFENNVWRRSTQSLICNPNILTQIGTADFKKAAIASYGSTDGDGNPLVYLDGKDMI